MWQSVSDVHLEKAKLLLEHQKYALAEQELHQVLAVNPNDSVAHALLGLCYHKTAKYPEAFTSATRAISLDAESDYNHRLLSLVYERQKNLPEAEKAARHAVMLNPDFAFGYALLGRILFNQSRLKEALEAVETGLCCDPEDIECLNLQARIFIRIGKPEAATENFRNSLKQDPENFYTHTNNGIALGETGDYQNAIVHFKEAVKLNPDYDLAKRYLLTSYKMQYRFYHFVTHIAAGLLKSQVSEKWLLLFGFWFMFKVSPLLLPFYLILLHFSLYNDVFFHFLLSLKPETKHLVHLQEKRQFKIQATIFLMALGTFTIGKFTETPWLVNVAMVLTSLSIPLIGTYFMKSRESAKRSFLFFYYLTLGAMLYLVLSYFFPENTMHAGLPEAALFLFNFGLLGYCWFRKKL